MRSKACRRRSPSSSARPRSNPRSTVATTTEIYDYLRVLFARAGTPHCWECGRRDRSQTPSQIVDAVMRHPAGHEGDDPLAADPRPEGRAQGHLRARSTSRASSAPASMAQIIELQKPEDAPAAQEDLRPQHRSRSSIASSSSPRSARAWPTRSRPRCKLSQGLVIVADRSSRRQHGPTRSSARNSPAPSTRKCQPAGAGAAALQLQLARTAPARTVTAWARPSSSIRT